MIPRHLLPQIPDDKMGEFREFVSEKGISVEDGAIPPSRIHPIQQHINREKVDDMKANANGEWQSIMVADVLDNPDPSDTHVFVLDGHHRYIAQKELNPDQNINVVWFHCPIKELVKLGHDFEHSFVKTVYETATYKQLALSRWC